jgi:hypothetical protein
MMRMTEDEKRRWIASLTQRIRRRVAATVRSSRARAEVAEPLPRDVSSAPKEDR